MKDFLLAVLICVLCIGSVVLVAHLMGVPFYAVGARRVIFIPVPIVR